MRVHPGAKLPPLKSRVIKKGGGESVRWSLAGEKPEKLALLAFYRGAFCPICRVWLGELDRLVPQFEKRGVSVIALSCDRREGAEHAIDDWELKRLRVGYKLEVDDARKAGLYLSEGRGKNPITGVREPVLFTEPALMLARPDGTLYAAWIQSLPYARPHIAEVLTAVDNLIAQGLKPPRGGA